MAHCRFKSMAFGDIGDKSIAYAYDGLAWSGGRPPIDEAVLMYQTYGDGMTPHSNDYPIGEDYFVDYCYSLATYLTSEGKDDYGTSHKLSQDLTSDRDITFAATIRHKPPTDKNYAMRRYSVEEQKISSSDSKRHDKRYEEIATWMDGSPEAIVRILWKDHYSPLQTYALRQQIRDWTLQDRNKGLFTGYMEIPHIRAKHDQHLLRQQHSAWNCLQNVYAMINARYAVETRLGEYRRGLAKVSAETEAA